MGSSLAMRKQDGSTSRNRKKSRFSRESERKKTSTYATCPLTIPRPHNQQWLSSNGRGLNLEP
eukprot:scaffold1692_cov59-Phaeocystis_antarctica.AAC.2